MLDVINGIKNIVSDKRTIFVGLDGLGGAGKSTVSEEMQRILKNEEYNVFILHIDDFIHKRAVRYNDNYKEWECYYNLQWRYDYLLESVINPLKSGKESIKFELYDKENDTYFDNTLYVPIGSIIIIEGVFLQRSEIKDIFDYMIYIDVSEEIRLERVLKRDTYIGETDKIKIKYENRYFPAERVYVKEYSPVINADIVI